MALPATEQYLSLANKLDITAKKYEIGTKMTLHEKQK